jgi:FAD:protein FMN transferase
MDTDSVRRAQPHLGTYVEIYSGGANRAATERAVDAAFAEIAKVHRLMSFQDTDSDVSRINREAYERAVLVNTRTYKVLEAALEVGQRSAGLFDVTAAPLVQQHGRPPPRGKGSEYKQGGAQMRESVVLLPGNRVRFRRSGTRIDVGGIAKGFAVDRAIDVLRKHDQYRGLVNAGGDLSGFGSLPQAIHIRDPRVPGRSLCQVAIKNAALASSARSFDLVQNTDFGAMIIDPRSREPSQDIAGATVRAQSCMIADALTKVVMIVGGRADVLLKKYQASALFVLTSGEIFMTPEWQDAISAAA